MFGSYKFLSPALLVFTKTSIIVRHEMWLAKDMQSIHALGVFRNNMYTHICKQYPKLYLDIMVVTHRFNLILVELNKIKIGLTDSSCR